MVINSLKRLKFFSWDNLFATFVVIAVLYFLPILFTIDFLDPIQNTIQDFNSADIVFSQIRDEEKVEKDKNIVLINIGYLNRKGIAELINIINSYNPRVIGIDSFFRKPKAADQDSALAQALRRVKNLVLVCEAEHTDNDDKFDTLVCSNGMFNKYALNSFANIITDDKSGFRVVRSISPKELVKDSTVLFFALEVAKFKNTGKVQKFLKRNKDVEFVNYKRTYKNKTYEVLDCKDVISKRDKLGFLKDKIVLMGFLGPDINTTVFEDIFFTPLNKHYLGKALPDMYGIEVHANVISMIFEEDYIGSTPEWLKLILTFVIIYCNMALFFFIQRSFGDVYEMANLFITGFEIFLIFAVMIYVFYWFNFDIGFREGVIFGIIFSATGFELYHGSFKPITISIAKNLYERGMKRASDRFLKNFGSGTKKGKEE